MAASRTPFELTATEALQLLSNGTITVEEYARSLLGRIRERDDTVKAWTYLDPDLVLSEARRLDQIPREQRGPLHGVAVGIKDVMDTKDMPTEYGSPLFKGYRPSCDASSVAILRAAGALIFGKTTTTEFTVTNSGPKTTNPHDPNRTPGGSSCGSAAAVADLQVPLSLGVQTGGSVIRPASYTGTFAIKPSHNAISTDGQTTFSISFDTIGVFARSVEDLQLVAGIYSVKDDDPPNDIPLKEASVALVKTPFWSKAGQGTIATMERATTILRGHGVKVEEVSLPSEIDDQESLARLQKVITSGEAQVAFLRVYREDKTKLAPQVRRLVENHNNYSHKERMEAMDRYGSIRSKVDEIAAKYTAILTPSAVDEAPLGLDDMGSPIFNTLWTGLHMPVVNIPAFKGEHGMPIGVSLVAGRFRDQHLLRIAKVLGEPLMAEGGWKMGPGSVDDNVVIGPNTNDHGGEDHKL